MPFRRYFYVGVIAGVALALFLIRLWQPEEQVNKHSRHLLDALAARNWPTFAAFIAEDYHDQWGNDRTAVLERTREIFRYLRDTQITAVDSKVRVEQRRGYWQARIIVEGKGNNEVLGLVKERVNNLQSPFGLEWQHVSGKPWDWKLVAVRNPDLVVPAEY